MTVDLSTLPHLLIAGRTGTGKSVCLNSIITSMVMTRRPDEVRMLMIDPKMVELSPYKNLPHLMHPVVTDMKKAEAILAWAVEKMEERYHLLARAGVRHLSGYNQLGEEELMERIRPENDDERRQIPTHMPYIVIVADELADLMMTSAKEVETHIIRLAQKSRAVGIHLVLATQKPTVDVITGLIKSNLPARICFQVASRTDSRVVLDEMGADKLLGNGDMLFLWPGTSTLLRGQGTYLSDDEINRVIAAVATSEPQFVKELVQLKAAASEGESQGGVKKFADRDELYEAAIDVVVREGRGSVSLLQRALGIGYGRAARLIDFMAEDGIVGQYNGSQAREVIISLEQWAEMSGSGSVKPPAAEPPKRNNTIMLAPPEERRSTGAPLRARRLRLPASLRKTKISTTTMTRTTTRKTKRTRTRKTTTTKTKRTTTSTMTTSTIGPTTRPWPAKAMRKSRPDADSSRPVEAGLCVERNSFRFAEDSAHAPRQLLVCTQSWRRLVRLPFALCVYSSPTNPWSMSNWTQSQFVPEVVVVAGAGACTRNVNLLELSPSRLLGSP